MRVGRTLLVVAFAASLLVQAVLFPPFRAPDERAHVDMARYVGERLADGRGLVYPPDDERQIAEAVHEAVRRSRDEGGLAPLPAADAPPRGTRPSFAALEAPGTTDARNAATQHPPLYYGMVGAASRVLERGEAPPFDLHVVLLRLLTAALLVPLPLLCAAAARRLGAGLIGAGTAALVPLAVPMLAHIGASVNNDPLLLAVFAAMTPLCLAVARGRASWPAAVGLGVLGGAALLTKGFALVAPAWLALAFGSGYLTVRRRVLLWQGVVSIGIASLLGGWWWLRNLAVLGEIQPHHASFRAAGADFAPDWVWWAPFAVLRFARRFWIEPDTVGGAPPWELAPTAGLLALVVLGALAAWRRRLHGPLLVALFPSAALTALIFYGGVSLYLETGEPFGIHGRYVYPGLLGVAALVGLAAHAAGGRRGRAVLVGLGVTAGVLQAVAWTAALRTYWGTGAGVGPALEALGAWSPLPLPLVALAALVHWLALPAGIWLLLREDRAGGRTAASSCRADRDGRSSPIPRPAPPRRLQDEGADDRATGTERHPADG
jgi:MYXO-CTERM domain-containing protein